MERLFEFDIKNENVSHIKLDYQAKNISPRDIAVIGMSGRFGSAESIQAFWEGLREGKEYNTQLSEARQKDCENYLEAMGKLGIKTENFRYFKAGFMERIDQFDCAMFNISPKEASLMDPNQRLLLQVIYEAIEDAGYGDKKLAGSRTGVYVGYSNDFGEDYKRYCRIVSDAVEEAAVTGNIRSIIGSRISYILDLKGPSITVDTACSSALVAVHTACQAIRSGDCSMAVAGSVKLNIVPADYRILDGNIGILSSIEKARTFDDSSDGTGRGEGAGAVILKPLNKAIEDGDLIYAIIKGSAVNQDGASMGITAPNMAAQEEVILRSWKDANIDPETITYIETHGTGTKLGDPIEIAGIQRAFEHFTQRKQFCAVASVKTNVGHLDNAAGIVSFIKAVMAVKTGELPPTLNFQRPNRKIAFEDSPVYVNDKLKKWGGNGCPRRCGISSFGLSGTNCHVILEEYIPNDNKQQVNGMDINPCIFALSAKKLDSMHRLIAQYDTLFKAKTGLDMKRICHTANTGRGHYNIRLALIIKSAEDLREKISLLKESQDWCSYEHIGVFFSEHKIVSDSKSIRGIGEITESQKRTLDNDARSTLDRIRSLTGQAEYESEAETLCRLYVSGAAVDWEQLYPSRLNKKERLPYYPFSKERHWVEYQKADRGEMHGIYGNIGHPILDRCMVQSIEADIYATSFNVEKQWVLKEHKVVGMYIVPGTAYIEMIREAAVRYYPKEHILIKDIMFITPLIVNEGSGIDAQLVIKEGDGCKGFYAASQSGPNGEWTKHVEGTFTGIAKEEGLTLDLNALKSQLTDIRDTEHYKTQGRGPRFLSMRRIHKGKDALLAYIELPKDCIQDMEAYDIHPALLDCAVILNREFLEAGFYLPLSYKNFRIYGKMPAKIYSYMTVSDKEKDNTETASFSLSLADENGHVFATTEAYTVKKVHEQAYEPVREDTDRVDLYGIGWREKPLVYVEKGMKGKTCLILGNFNETTKRIAKGLEEKGLSVQTADLGIIGKNEDGDHYTGADSESCYRRFLSALNPKPSYIIHALTLEDGGQPKCVHDLEETMERGVYSLFYLVKTMLAEKLGSVELFLVTDYAYQVTGRQRDISPQHAAFLGLGKTIEKEYPGISCKCIDIDNNARSEDIIAELTSMDDAKCISYRDRKRYVEIFEELALPQSNRAPVEMKSDGIYVITGGMGGIGLAFAQYLASKHQVNIALLSRSILPPRDTWDDLLKAGTDAKLCQRISAVKKIEEQGSKVFCYRGNIADRVEVQSVFKDLRERFGRINGIIHGAGVAGDGYIINKTLEGFKQVMEPKTIGTWLLDKMTEEDPLDFFVMHSSVSSLLGSAGQGDYTAANAYMDAYGYLLGKRRDRVLTINWPAWKETGMAVDYGAVSEEALFRPISTSTALKAFERLLNDNAVRAIPAKLNYRALNAMKNELPIQLSDGIQHLLNKLGHISDMENQNRDQGLNLIKVTLKGKLEHTYTETEKELAQIWSLVLGIKEVDVYDSFNDLGGDSILSTRLLKEMQKKYHDLIDISDVFTYSTINKMADYIDRKTGNKVSMEKIEEQIIQKDEELDLLLGQIASGEISVEEAEKLLSLEEIE